MPHTKHRILLKNARVLMGMENRKGDPKGERHIFYKKPATRG